MGRTKGARNKKPAQARTRADKNPAILKLEAIRKAIYGHTPSRPDNVIPPPPLPKPGDPPPGPTPRSVKFLPVKAPEQTRVPMPLDTPRIDVTGITRIDHAHPTRMTIDPRTDPTSYYDALQRTAPHTYAQYVTRDPRTGISEWQAARHLTYIGRRIAHAVGRGNGRLMINMSPRHGKSELISHWTPLWFLELFPKKKVMCCSYDSSLAENFGRKCRDSAHSNPLVRVALMEDNKSVAQWNTKQGGGMKCGGVGTGITGWGFDCFPKGVILHTEAGPRDIAEVATMRNPPRILSLNHQTGRLEYRRVLASRTLSTRRLTIVRTTSGRSLASTPDHRHYSVERGYTPVGILRAGETLITLPLTRMSVSVALVETVCCESQPVYDIQVEGNSNFFANGILVHNCGLVDDPVKDVTDAKSPAMQKMFQEWWESQFIQRKEPNATIIMLGHRFDVDDPYGYLLQQPDGDKWEVIRLPSIAEANDPLGRRPGEALWPERWPVEQLEEARKGIMWRAMHMQDPQPERGDRVYDHFQQGVNVVPNAERGDLALRKGPDEVIALMLDFNVNPGMHGEVGQNNTQADEVYIDTEFHGERWRTEHLMKEFIAWFKANDGHKAWKHVAIYGDRSGTTRNTVTAQTDYGLITKMLNEARIQFRMNVPMKNPPVNDRVITMNEALCDGAGVPHLFINKRCVRLLVDLNKQPRDEDGQPDKSDHALGHAGDCAGYFCFWVRPVMRTVFRPANVVFS